jgi:hypothetical protein
VTTSSNSSVSRAERGSGAQKNWSATARNSARRFSLERSRARLSRSRSVALIGVDEMFCAN